MTKTCVILHNFSSKTDISNPPNIKYLFGMSVAKQIQNLLKLTKARVKLRIQEVICEAEEKEYARNEGTTNEDIFFF